MSASNALTSDAIARAISTRPQSFLTIDFEKARSSKKSANRYMDVLITLEDGKKKKLGISWKLEALRGGIKSPEERKYGVTIQYRKSSGTLGTSAVSIYEEFKRLTQKAISDGALKVKGTKAAIHSIIQTEMEDGETLEDPIVRFKLPFNKDGKPEFRLVRIEDINANPTPVDIKCSEGTIHELIQSRMITSGYASIDTVIVSGFGISMPAKVQLLVIKPIEFIVPEISTILNRDEMISMIGAPSATPSETGEKETKDNEEEGEEISVEDQLLQLKQT
jgi:hypothetical protein